MNLKEELQKIIEGDVEDSPEVIEEYSHDASLFRVTPQIVVFPKHVEDVKSVVSFVEKHKQEFPNLSITGRAAGSDMTGGPLGESIILSFTRYFKKEEVDIQGLKAIVEPGVFYRDFEKETLPEHVSMPVFPASKQLAAFGGMVMNNCGGERTLRYGQMRDFVDKVSVVLRDGNEYTFGPIGREELEEKKKQDDFEGEIYRSMFKLLDENYDLVKGAEPNVSKNSSGYALWRVWDRERGVFDLSQLFVGSQGTLGMLTRANISLVKDKEHKRLVALFFKSWDGLPQIVNTLLPLDPESLEAFDEDTLKLGIRFLPEIAERTHTSFFKFAWKFLPEAWIGVKMMEIPDLVILVELAESSEEELDQKTEQVVQAIKDFDLEYRVLYTEEEENKYWVMRRESFNLLRQKVKGKRTVPLVEDFCVRPEKLPEFLPKAIAILKKYGIRPNIAGHAGNGNFHIIPLMDLTKKSERDKLIHVANEFNSLVIEHEGTISAEHNDGILRTPYLEKMFGSEAYNLFKEVKNIFDPNNIFNPGKKVGGTLEYLESHISQK